MAVGLRSQSAPSTSSTTSIDITLPAGVQAGDYLIAFVHGQLSSSTSDFSASGWTRIGASFVSSDNESRITGMYAKVATGSETSPVTFSGMTSSARIVGFAAAFTGVDTADPVAYESGWSKVAGTGASLSVAAESSTADLYTLEIWAANFASPNSYALSSYDGGLTLLGEGYNPSGAENTGVSRSALRVWSGVAPGTGVPAHSITTTGSSPQRCAYLVALNPDTSGLQPTTTPVVVGHTTASASGSGSPFTVDPTHNLVGSAVADDDWILAIFSSASNMVGTKQPTPPAGWTNILPLQDPGTGFVTYGIWAHQRASGETTYDWTQTTAEPDNTQHRLVFVRGADDIANWVIGTAGTRAGSGGTTDTTAPSVTTTLNHTLGLLLAGERTTATETDPQVTCDNFTKQWFENNVDHSLFVATKDMISPGATGDVTVSYPNVQSQNGIALILGIPGTPGSSTNGLSIKVSDGSGLVDAKFKLADGVGGFTVPGDYKVVRPGYSSVTEMLAQTTFYCAHRGGSRDFPEMSLYAYGQSALVGYPALELSLARTSDGVWFGLHDSTLDRTSGVSGVDPSTLTWAQVQAYEILGSVATNNPTQPNRPYMRWEELIDMYYFSHVIFVDPKVAISYRSELLDMMDALPNSTDKFVAKYYGVSGGAGNTSGWNFDAKARGYTTWGYFYAADSANYATYAPRWDILGMDYTAAQSYWDDLAAAGTGQPMMGHICPDAAAVSTALSKGADGVMVSGVKSAVPPEIT